LPNGRRPSTLGDVVTEAETFWNDRYAERAQIWSGRPNTALVTEVEGLAPGRALDLGCGEGGDSVWLAEHGWRVTAVDIAANAVARGRDAAATRGIDEGRIGWLVEDLATWTPPGPYDLVSACFLHSPVDFPRTEVLRRAAAALAPGGHLLVVGHSEPPPWSRHRHEDDDHRFLTPAEEVAELALDPSAWETVVCESRTRDAVGPDGEQATLDDSIVLLRRR
jgi:SAM-dependent methyltransferase